MCCLILAGLYGCDDDAEPTTDAGHGADTGVVDSGATQDTGPLEDTGPGADTGPLADSGPEPDAGSTVSCETADDCVWGEIDHEIQDAADCVCLFGCPTLVQNRETRDRRAAQYDAHCDPSFDGNGDPCPIDDCISPPALSCTENVCVAPDSE